MWLPLSDVAFISLACPLPAHATLLSLGQVSPAGPLSVPPSRGASGPRPLPVHSCSVDATLGGRHAGTPPEEPAWGSMVEGPGGLGEASEASLHSSSHSTRFMVHELLGLWMGPRWAEHLRSVEARVLCCPV